MYRDIISYELAEGVSEEQLLSVVKRIHNEWLCKQEGFIKWEIHQNSKGGYTDIVSWQSQEASKKSEANMGIITNVNEWYGCYKKDLTSCYSANQILSLTA